MTRGHKLPPSRAWTQGPPQGDRHRPLPPAPCPTGQSRLGPCPLGSRPEEPPQSCGEGRGRLSSQPFELRGFAPPRTHRHTPCPGGHSCGRRWPGFLGSDGSQTGQQRPRLLLGGGGRKEAQPPSEAGSVSLRLGLTASRATEPAWEKAGPPVYFDIFQRQGPSEPRRK